MTSLMAIEILAAEFIVARYFARREYFYLRFFGSAFVCVFMTIWIEMMYFFITGNEFNYGSSPDASSIVFKIFYYITIFGMTILCLRFSYKQSFIVILVCASIGYAMQYLAYNLSMLLNVFGGDLASPFAEIYEAVTWLVTRAAVYVSFFFILSRRKFEEEFYHGNNKKKVLIWILVIFVCIGLSRLSYDDPDRSDFAKIAEPIYAVMCSMFIIFAQFSMANNDTIHKELSDVTELLHSEREQYRLAKENIEIINEKCHDLKHQIGLLREDRSEKYLAEVENAIMIYDSTVKTGSDVLDILLTEKKLQCDSKNIKFTTVVNGKLLEFMDEMDVYSLFGNAISNAIESVAGLPDEDMRHIALKVQQIGDMCSIHIENYYAGEISFADGLPQTDKDKNFHGFGMRSMNRIVTSYGGVMTVTAKNSLFCLDILLPV